MATRLKTKAVPAAVPQTKDACAADIRALGDLQRDFDRLRHTMNVSVPPTHLSTQSRS